MGIGKRLALAAVVALVLGLAAGTAAYTLEQSPEFCASCHEIKPAYETWLRSGVRRAPPDVYRVPQRTGDRGHHRSTNPGEPRASGPLHRQLRGADSCRCPPMAGVSSATRARRCRPRTTPRPSSKKSAPTAIGIEVGARRLMPICLAAAGFGPSPGLTRVGFGQTSPPGPLSTMWRGGVDSRFRGNDGRQGAMKRAPTKNYPCGLWSSRSARGHGFPLPAALPAVGPR